MATIENGSTAPITFFLVNDVNDEAGVTGITTSTIVIQLSKNGGAMTAITTPTITEIGLGAYTWTPTATHTNTNGFFTYVAYAPTGTNVWRDIHQVVTTPTTVTLGDISTTIANKLADHIWRRSFANIRASSWGDTLAFRSGYGMMAKLVNKLFFSDATTLAITAENDSTVVGTQTVGTNPSAAPVTSLDTN